MQLVVQSYQGLSFFLHLNADRFFTFGTVIAGLLAGAFIGSAMLNP